MTDHTHAPARPVAVFDLDGSLMREQLLALMVRESIDGGLFSPEAATEFRGLYKEFQDRKIAFEVYDRKLIEIFTRHIIGQEVAAIEEVARRVAIRHCDLLYTFSRSLLAELQATHQCITVTGALHEVVKQLAPYWGFEHFYATELEVVDGKYTGRDRKVHFHDKERTLRSHLALPGVTHLGLVALGDTFSDASMLALAELPIAFNPNDRLTAEAEKRGWPIVVERKDCIYVMRSGSYRRFHIAESRGAVRYLIENARMLPVAAE